MKKSDLVFIITPFLLTLLLIVIGYQILISTTPEAGITPDIDPQTKIEILENGDIPRIPPQVPQPRQLLATINNLPQSQQQLNNLISQAKSAQVNTIYLSIPITVNPDHTIKLTDQDLSSEENILRWAKTTISAAHQNQFQVILSLTLNASQTLSDPVAFTQNFLLVLEKWAGLVTEYGVTFFTPGLTVGHPLYAQLTPQQMQTLILQTERGIRKKYSGMIGINICCTTEVPQGIKAFSFATLIPTPEYDFTRMEPITSALNASNSVSYVLHYDRSTQQITSAQ